MILRGESAESAKSAKSAKSAESAESTESAKSAESAKSTKSAKSEKVRKSSVLHTSFVKCVSVDFFLSRICLLEEFFVKGVVRSVPCFLRTKKRSALML